MTPRRDLVHTVAQDSTDWTTESEMILGIWIESTVSERIANRGWVHRHGWVGGIRAASIQLQRRSSWPGPELLSQRGDRS